MSLKTKNIFARTRPLHRSCLLFSYKFGSLVILVIMMLWNKVTTVFSYVNDVQFGADEGLVRVDSTKSEGSLLIFAVGVN